MKIVFLDFDGVIRSTRSRLAAITADGFDPIAGQLIAQVATRSCAQIVISSSWREGRDREAVSALLSQACIPATLLHEDWATPVLDVARQQEIAVWLERYPAPVTYAVIDDGIGLENLMSRVIPTEMDEGFGFPHALRLCALLNHDPRPWLKGVEIGITSAEAAAYSPKN